MPLASVLGVLDKSVERYTLTWYRDLPFKGIDNCKRRDHAKNL
jgi:hypothetical protein